MSPSRHGERLQVCQAESQSKAPPGGAPGTQAAKDPFCHVTDPVQAEPLSGHKAQTIQTRCRLPKLNPEKTPFVLEIMHNELHHFPTNNEQWVPQNCIN